MNFRKIMWAQGFPLYVLFVYGSLMISDFYYDFFESPTEWSFDSEVVRCCMCPVMCPAKVQGYACFAVHDSQEPVMMKANYKVTHGMLIFGLTVEGIRILDRYLSRGFVRGR